MVFIIQIRPLFEQHGNVLEVALIKDKRTGQQQGMLLSILLGNSCDLYFFKISGLLKRLMGSNPSLIIGLHLFATIFELIAYAGERLSVTEEGYLCSLLRKGLCTDLLANRLCYLCLF